MKRNSVHFLSPLLSLSLFSLSLRKRGLEKKAVIARKKIQAAPFHHLKVDLYQYESGQNLMIDSRPSFMHTYIFFIDEDGDIVVCGDLCLFQPGHGSTEGYQGYDRNLISYLTLIF